MEIKVLFGNRIYLEMPEEREPSTSIYLDKATKDAIDTEEYNKWSRLRVYAIGEGAKGLGLNEGDEVMLDPSSPSIARGMIKIHLSPERSVIMVSFHDIAHLW